jgi:hypothetical protein
MSWIARGVLSYAVINTCCLFVILQNALVEKGCAPALPCKLAAVMIHRRSGLEEGCAILRAMQAHAAVM